jgi:hypothetical protein
MRAAPNACWTATRRKVPWNPRRLRLGLAVPLAGPAPDKKAHLQRHRDVHHPVAAHNSPKIVPFSVRLDRLSRIAIALVAVCRWLIVSPITKAYRISRGGRRV